MRAALKRLVIGSRWEGPVRRLHHAVTGHRGSLYDAQTIEVMRRVLHPDSNAIDAGAFEGGLLRHIVRLAPRGKHLAFEPLPEYYARLRARFPNVALHPFALGERPGESEYVRVVKHPALSGLRANPSLGPDEAVERLPVVVETLDRIVPDGMPVAFVKVDVEGGELGLFRGGAATLARTRPHVVFECGRAAEAFGATAKAIYESMAAPGLRVSTLDAWLHGGSTLAIREFQDLFASGREFYFIAHP